MRRHGRCGAPGALRCEPRAHHHPTEARQVALVTAHAPNHAIAARTYLGFGAPANTVEIIDDLSRLLLALYRPLDVSLGKGRGLPL